ncbi:unnamed protein product [Cercopithifilaria johnstoni]|uniref:Uncharacterized protein n=1 Tax=Cercopithifilaria johnstoni TaxID=2874296 RepID=A0A8J2M263_9BILA|nr:unnamed protein product [Cercopithifilaria johnstoni]
MSTELLFYCILPVLALAQNALSEEANEYRQDLWSYVDDTEQWPNPNELSNLLKRWASQLRFGKRTSWASKVRFG